MKKYHRRKERLSGGCWRHGRNFISHSTTVWRCLICWVWMSFGDMYVIPSNAAALRSIVLHRSRKALKYWSKLTEFTICTQQSSYRVKKRALTTHLLTGKPPLLPNQPQNSFVACFLSQNTLKQFQGLNLEAAMRKTAASGCCFSWGSYLPCTESWQGLQTSHVMSAGRNNRCVIWYRDLFHCTSWVASVAEEYE